MAGSSPASSASSTKSSNIRDSDRSHERTPLLSRNSDDDVPSYTTQAGGGDPESPAASSLRQRLGGEARSERKRGHRWPTTIALSTLCVVVLVILALGFAAPAAVQEYAKEAVVFKPTTLSIDSFTPTGVRARVQGEFQLHHTRVHNKAICDIGKALTYVAKEIETGESELKVYLPAYDNLLMGTAKIPPIKVNIRSGHINLVDFLTDLEPGHVDGFRRLANDWLGGRLGSLEVEGVAILDLKSGIFSFGNQTISQSLILAGNNIPSIPDFEISKLDFFEIDEPRGSRSMAAEASVSIANGYPIRLDVPRLAFDILIPNCQPRQEYLLLAKAVTGDIEIRPSEPVTMSVNAIIRELPTALKTACPGTHLSPIDELLASYIAGQNTIIYVRGSEAPSNETPQWVSDLIRSVTVPLPFPGHTFDNLIRNFSLSDVQFSLPEPTTDPDEPEAEPMVSAVVNALVGLPKEMNFPLDVHHVRADAEVFYHDRKLGQLDLHEWQATNTTQVEDAEDGPALLVQSIVRKAPLHITDDDVFTEVVQALIFGAKGVVLGVKAKVDVKTLTALGDFVVRDVPAEGKIFVKPLSGGLGFSGFKPTFGDLRIVGSTTNSLTLQAKVNVTNPTEYSAHVPYANLHILNNDTLLGHATTKNIMIVPGNNTNVDVEVLWNPFEASGQNGSSVGRNLISQYISGFNTTLTLKTHENSIPSQPALGRALSALELTIETPKFGSPGTPGHGGGKDEERDSGPQFIKDATMHLISSTAAFTLLSPLERTTLYITSIAAVAFYNHTEPVGTIDYDLPFAVPAGASTTPRLPVAWSLGGAGYDAVRDALGGSLKLDATADVGIRIDHWQEQIWFIGGGIGAHIRL